LRELRGALSPPPLEATLRAGLLVLEHADLRADVASLTCPTQIFLGENDAVVPVRAAAAWRALRPTTGSGQVPTTGSGPVPTTGSGPVQSMPVTVVPGAGHAPFLSAPGSFVEECLKARSCVPVHA
jgi:pimeloyl-ACP methyl ester carboxylesterase